MGGYTELAKKSSETVAEYIERVAEVFANNEDGTMDLQDYLAFKAGVYFALNHLQSTADNTQS